MLSFDARGWSADGYSRERQSALGMPAAWMCEYANWIQLVHTNCNMSVKTLWLSVEVAYRLELGTALDHRDGRRGNLRSEIRTGAAPIIASCATHARSR